MSETTVKVSLVSEPAPGTVLTFTVPEDRQWTLADLPVEVRALIEDAAVREAQANDYYCGVFEKIMIKLFGESAHPGHGELFVTLQGLDCRKNRWRDEDGYDINGLGYHGFDREGFDAKGFDRDGFDREGKDRDGIHRDDPRQFRFDVDGYDSDGYNVDGFDRKGWHRTHAARTFDRAGYDANGYTARGYGRDGAYSRAHDARKVPIKSVRG